MGVEERNEVGEEMASLSSPTETTGRIKFYCSNGGRIMPRPSDGTLKYIGGETRAIAVPRSITFQELMNKINNLFDGEYVLKYQIAKEDLDSLVSVKSDEDLCHMLDEYDRLERSGLSKFRTFLFLMKPVMVESHTLSGLGPHATDQRFIDAVNGIVRPTNLGSKPPLLNTGHVKSFSPSPTEGSPQSLSPRSTVTHNSSLVPETSLISNLQSRLARVHKVQSSPNLCTLNPRHHYPAMPHQHYYHGCPSSGVALDHHHHSPGHQGYQSPVIAPDHHYSPGHQVYQSLGIGSDHHHTPGHQGFQSPIIVPDHHHTPGHQGYQSPGVASDHHHSPSQQSYQSPSITRDPRHSPGHQGYQSPNNGHDYVHPSSQAMISRSEYSRVPLGNQGTNQNTRYYYAMSRGYPGSGGHRRWGHLDQYSTPSVNLPRSPCDPWEL